MTKPLLILQYRLLAADRKSLKSVSSEGPTGTSRRSSNGSASPTSISVHSVTSGGNEMCNNVGGNTPEYSDKTWNYWGRIVNDWEEQRKKNGKQLKVRLLLVKKCNFDLR